MYETNLVGKRQEILDEVFNIESDKTPFLSKLKIGKRPLAMLATWVAEIIPDASSTGILDGTAATTPSRVDRYLLQGVSQHFRKEWGVTDLAVLTEAAGVKDEVAHQRELAMKLLKRSMEVQFLSSEDSTIEASSTPWTTRGAFSWLANAAQTQHIVNANLRPASACLYSDAVADLSESDFRTMLEAAYAAVKQPVNLNGFVGYDLKAVLDDFTNVYPVASTTSQPKTSYRIQGNSKYMEGVDVLSFSTGVVALELDPFILCTTSTGAATASTPKSGIFLNMDQWDIGYMQKPANTNLADDGSGKKGFIDAVAILRCKNPLGQIHCQCAT
jgi:hypothetical protein